MKILFYIAVIGTGLMGLAVFYRASETGSKGQKIAALCYGAGAIIAAVTKSWIPLLVGWILTFVVRQKFGDPDQLVSATLIQQYKQRAESGDADAQFEMGVLHQYGRGVRQDFAEALSLYRKAAAQGHNQAQSNLGILYASGQGVHKDYSEAIKWFTMAAEQGDAFAQNNLGRLYSMGEGVAQDYVAAYMWLDLAAEGLTGREKEKVELNRDSFLASHMTEDEIKHARKLSSDWREKHKNRVCEQLL
jgi:TPR repeat protein